MDIAEGHPDENLRRRVDSVVAWLALVVKAAFADFGFEIAVLPQQVFSGYVYRRRPQRSKMPFNRKVADYPKDLRWNAADVAERMRQASVENETVSLA